MNRSSFDRPLSGLRARLERCSVCQADPPTYATGHGRIYPSGMREYGDGPRFCLACIGRALEAAGVKR